MRFKKILQYTNGRSRDMMNFHGQHRSGVVMLSPSLRVNSAKGSG